MVVRRTARDKAGAGVTITTMPPPTFLRTTAALVASLALTAAALPASAQPAQSPSELRRENVRLREQVRTLEAQLEASRSRIARLGELVASLEARVAELRAAAAAESDQRETEPGDGSIDLETGQESQEPADPPVDGAAETEQRGADDPFASPGAMQRSLQREYQAAVGDLPRETEDQVDRYLREVRQWVRRVNLTRRKAVEWRVELLDVEVLSPTEARCRFRVAGEDESDAEPFDAPFPLELSGRHAGRVIEHSDHRLWTLDGLFAATPHMNEDRVEPGVFNTPPLIGPYAEFDFEFRVRSLRPVDEEADRAASSGG